MDFGILKRNNPKTGRRAKQNSEKSESPVVVDDKPASASRPIESSSSEGGTAPQRPSRRNTTLSGWGEPTSGKKAIVEDSRLQITEDDSVNDLIDSIQVIPDVDEVNGEEIIQQMAAPPSIAINQMATYRELDSDLRKKATFQMLDNEIDLKLLAKHLLPESEVKEPKESWEWERLFTDVTSQIDPASIDIKN